MNSCAVTNESVLLPGVTVHPEAVLGVHTLGRPGQVFPPHSITQGELCLFPGHDLEGGKPYVEPEGPNPKAVSAYIYWRYNVLYWLATCFFVPLTGERARPGPSLPPQPGAPAAAWRPAARMPPLASSSPPACLPAHPPLCPRARACPAPSLAQRLCATCP